jgi:tRNA(His) guanylyltransferase
VCSIFTSAYVFHWSTYFPDKPLRYPPTFDSRVVLYPGVQEVRDYFAWRQADSEIILSRTTRMALMALASAYQQSAKHDVLGFCQQRLVDNRSQ